MQKSMRHAAQKKSGAAKSWRSLMCANTSMIKRQRPKNSHNRRITGIGTPSSQSRSPRPILASMKTLRIQERENERQVPHNGMEKPLGNVRCSTLIAAAIEGQRL
jgi:hypothetical protein